MEHITPSVYVNTECSSPPLGRGCNYSFVTTSEGIVMIDSPMMPTYAARWRGEIAKKGEVRYLINTEYHGDHTFGNYFFPGTVISHQGVRDTLTGPLAGMISFRDVSAAEEARGLRQHILERYQEVDPEGMPLVKDYQVRLPAITYTDRLNLYVGKHAFQLIHLPGHTPYQTAVYLPQERVVFVGDNFSNKWQASIAQCCPLEWLQSLKKIEAMDVDFIVPGHGEIGDKAALREFTRFLKGAIDTVKKAIKQGMTREEAVEKISFEGERPARHPGAEQQRRNTGRLYDMLSKVGR